MKKYRTFDMELYVAGPGTEGTKILKFAVFLPALFVSGALKKSCY